MHTYQKNFGNIEIEDYVIGKKCGTIIVSIYKETKSGSPIFHVQPDNEDIIPISNVIEDALSLY